MPAYAYKCPKCETKFTAKHRFEDDSTYSECPECGAPAKKTFEAVPAHFKGGGWGGKR